MMEVGGWRGPGAEDGARGVRRRRGEGGWIGQMVFKSVQNGAKNEAKESRNEMRAQGSEESERKTKERKRR